MEIIKADLMVLDKSFPVLSELLRNDDWKIVYDRDKTSASFMLVETRDKRIELMDNLLEPEGEFPPELIEIF